VLLVTVIALGVAIFAAGVALLTVSDASAAYVGGPVLVRIAALTLMGIGSLVAGGSAIYGGLRQGRIAGMGKKVLEVRRERSVGPLHGRDWIQGAAIYLVCINRSKAELVDCRIHLRELDCQSNDHDWERPNWFVPQRLPWRAANDAVTRLGGGAQDACILAQQVEIPSIAVIGTPGDPPWRDIEAGQWRAEVSYEAAGRTPRHETVHFEFRSKPGIDPDAYLGWSEG